jgi:hypothetical protein
MVRDATNIDWCLNESFKYYVDQNPDLELLEIAYEKKSNYLLGEIFEKWHNNSKRLSNEEIYNLNDTLKETYQVFKTFYKPKKLNLIGGSEFGDTLYQNIKYALIQNSIYIEMKDKIYYTSSELDSFIINSIMSCNIDSTKKKYFSSKINGKFIPWVMATFQPEDIYEGKDKNVIERIEKNGKTYFKINDYMALRALFGELLREIQRIKSEGDYESGKLLVETYGVRVDSELHTQVLERVAPLNIAPYNGFVYPVMIPIYNEQKELIDVRLEYTQSFLEQMLYYGQKYSFE